MAVHVVLFEPEIPQNTGNILRTCVATETHVHIIKPLGFELSKETLKRSASNHLDHADYTLYENFESGHVFLYDPIRKKAAQQL